jgi:hypothetical protein
VNKDIERAKISGMRVEGDLILYDIKYAMHPQERYVCAMSRWWLVFDKRYIGFYKSFNSPLCNKQKAVAERLMKNSLLVKGFQVEAEHFHTVFTPQGSDA